MGILAAICAALNKNSVGPVLIGTGTVMPPSSRMNGSAIVVFCETTEDINRFNIIAGWWVICSGVISSYKSMSLWMLQETTFSLINSPPNCRPTALQAIGEGVDVFKVVAHVDFLQPIGILSAACHYFLLVYKIKYFLCRRRCLFL